MIVAGLDTRFAFSVAGVQVRRALRRGARLVAVDARESNLARMADEWVRTRPAEEAMALGRLIRVPPRRRVGGLAALCRRHTPTRCGGPDRHRGGATRGEVRGARRRDRVARSSAATAPANSSATSRGLARTSASRSCLSRTARTSAERSSWGSSARRLPVVRRPRVLYLVGEAPFTTRPDYDVVIAQDLYLPPFEVDAFLPAASFAEAAGTLTNIEGRVQELAAVEDRPAGGAHGYPRPDWKIFSDLASRLGRSDLEYADAAAVREAIRGEVKGFPAEQDRSPRRLRADGPRRGRPAGDVAAAAGARADGRGGRRPRPVRPRPRARGVPSSRHRPLRRGRGARRAPPRGRAAHESGRPRAARRRAGRHGDGEPGVAGGWPHRPRPRGAVRSVLPARRRLRVADLTGSRALASRARADLRRAIGRRRRLGLDELGAQHGPRRRTPHDRAQPAPAHGRGAGRRRDGPARATSSSCARRGGRADPADHRRLGRRRRDGHLDLRAGRRLDGEAGSPQDRRSHPVLRRPPGQRDRDRRSSARCC